MLRLFAPPLSSPAVPRSRVTLGSLLFHLALVAVMVIPVEPEARRALLDREVIYLVPLREPGAPELESGLAVSAVPGPLPSGPPAEGPSAEPAGAGADFELAVGRLRPTLSGAVWRETAVTELEVDSVVVRDPLSAAPIYPPDLLRGGVGGSVTVRYVVDTLGRVDPATYQVVSTAHQAFADAVRQALPGMLFRPAIQRGRRVRQWVEQRFQFRIASPDTAGAGRERKADDPA